jgi:glycosyltransferase involved in cell wall biosynthesis
LAPLHRSARRAYQGADKITAVGQSYLDLVKSYGADTPLHRCYHGAELSRFSKDYNDRLLTHAPLKAVYMGAMGFGYDLQSLVEVAARWKAENRFPAQIHFAGDGPQREALATRASELGLIADPTVGIKDSSRIIFHGQLGRDAVNKLLGSADLALVPNRPSTLVACPYKAGEYAAAGLPMISCLTGELNQLLSEWNAGSKYTEGDTDSLYAAFENYLTNTELLNQHSQNARTMAEALFDRETTYSQLAEFILASENRSQN